MLEKRRCKYCDKEYEADSGLGLWQKDGSQGPNKAGVSVKRYCCYECGKKDRASKIKQTWSNKSKSEIAELIDRRKNNVQKQVCAVCGIEFYPENSYGNKNGVYICSEKCRKKRFKRIPDSGLRSCQNCGKVYHYTEGQGCWDSNNNLVNKNGIGHGFVVRSDRFCCYECGIKYKESKRKVTNLLKYGRTSPFQDNLFREKLFNMQKKNGVQFISKGEKEIKEWLESLNLKVEHYITGNGLSKKSPRIEIDLYIPDLKIGIEYNGVYFHSMNGKKEGIITRGYHYQKSKIAKSLGIDLIHIWEDQWLNQKDLIKSILKARLGKVSKKDKIYARQCIIKEISTEEYKDFCIKNHIQGYLPAVVKLGLFYEGKLVQICSFGKMYNMGKAAELNSQYEWVWKRGCIASNNAVIGGTSKLFAYFVKKYNPETVLCYADWNLFNGKGYREAGFKLDGYTGPDKFYITADHHYLRINRNPYAYKELMEKVSKRKVWLCYGAGSMRFIWRRIKN